MGAESRISVVVVSLNGAARLPMCLAALRETDWPDLEVLLVDNGSTDGTSDVARREAPKARVIRAAENLGFAGGNNLGVAEATGEIVVLLNDDCEPRPDWLRAFARAAEELPDWGVLGAKLLYPDGETIQHAGGQLEPNGLTKHIGYGERDDGRFDERRECDYVTGAAFAIRREAIDRVGLLDDGYFPIYFEEIDYCWRAAEAGFGVHYVPDAVVIHHESMTTDRMSQGFLRKYHRNRVRFVLRSYRGARLRAALRREAAWLLRSRPWDCLLPVAGAYLSALFRLTGVRP